MPLPWSGQLAGRIDEHVVTSDALERQPPRRPRRAARCGCTCPPGYDEGDDRLPSIYVIQGYTGYLTMWANRDAYHQPFPETADAVFASGQAPPCIVVWVDAWTAYGGSQFVDSPGDGPVPLLSVRRRRAVRRRALPHPRRARPPRHPGEVQRRLRGHDHAHAAPRPVRRARHPRRGRPVRVLLHPRVPQGGAGPAVPGTATSAPGGTTSSRGRPSPARRTTCCS